MIVYPRIKAAARNFLFDDGKNTFQMIAQVGQFIAGVLKLLSDSLRSVESFSRSFLTLLTSALQVFLIDHVIHSRGSLLALGIGGLTSLRKRLDIFRQVTLHSMQSALALA